MHLSIGIAGNYRSRSVFIDSHCRPQYILQAIPSIAIFGDNRFQPGYFSTLLPGHYGGDVTYRYTYIIDDNGSRNMPIDRLCDDNIPAHGTIYYSYCRGHCLLSRMWPVRAKSLHGVCGKYSFLLYRRKNHAQTKVARSSHESQPLLWITTTVAA